MSRFYFGGYQLLDILSPEAKEASATAARVSSKRAFRLAVIEGFLFQTGMEATEASLVLAMLLRELGAATAIIGILPALRFAGWSLPQLFVANLLESRHYRMPVYKLYNGMRFPLYFILAAMVAFWGRSHPVSTVALFMLIYTATRVAAGVAAAARSDIVAKVIEPQALDNFFATRNLVGSIGGFLTGFLVSMVLGPGGPPYPWNYALLLTLSGIIFGVAWAVFGRISEPPTENPSPNHPWAKQFAGLKVLLRQDTNFGRYLIVRVLLSFVRIVDPFYALYAVDKLGVNPAMAGIYLSALTLARFLANPFWGHLGSKHGSQAVLRLSAFFSGLAPLLAVGIPLVGRLAGGIDSPVFPYLYGLVYIVNGFASTGSVIASYSYILAIAPDARRPTYIGLTNAVRGMMDLFTIFGGQAIDWWGYAPVFAVASLFIATGAALSWRLKGSPAQASVTYRRGDL